MTSQHDNTLLRIGVFIDGTYFSHVSNYYMYQHERRARLSITGLHSYIREEIAKQENIDRRFCQIVDAHYFRGRLDAKTSQDQDALYRERQWDDVLIREGVTMHFLPVTKDMKEKGIDVWFALEAFELAMYKRFNVSVLITGDGDFVPLVRKLNTLGTRVMLLAWDFEYTRDGKLYTTRTNQSLIQEVTYPVMMADQIDSRARKTDAKVEAMIDALFVKHRETPTSFVASDGELDKSGIILSINIEKGYGFIRPSESGDNLFFHVSSLQGCDIADLRIESAVYFRVIKTDRGPNAVFVRPILTSGP